jgi:acetyl-CoA acetyltransferase
MSKTVITSAAKTQWESGVSGNTKVLTKTGLKLAAMDVIELHEAFAAQAPAVLRDLGLPDDADVQSPGTDICKE